MIALDALIICYWILVGIREGYMTLATWSDFVPDNRTYHTVRFFEAVSVFAMILVATRIPLSYYLALNILGAWTLGTLLYNRTHSLMNGKDYWLTPYTFRVLWFSVTYKSWHVWLYVIIGIFLLVYGLRII